MTVSYVERDQASPETLAFYDKAEERFEMLLNIFKVFGHTPELGKVFTDLVMAILKDGELDWLTKELLILKATHRNDCQYCVVQHETLSKRLGISEEKIADIGSKVSPVCSASSRAIVVLPVPGGPQRITEDSRPAWSIRPSGASSPNRWSCPTTSSSDAGRNRSASGRGTSSPRSEASKRSVIRRV